MKRLFAISIIFAAGSVAAEGFPCAEPEYLFLKEASQAELRDKYCVLTRKAGRNDLAHQSTQQMIKEKRSLHLDTSGDWDIGMAELKAAGSCKVAAGAIADALSRRFKSKPPASCT